MKKTILATIMAVSASSLVGCGGESGSGSSVSLDPLAGLPTKQTKTVSGTVADGYLVYAKVCADINKDDICQDNEPRSETKEGGAYTLEVDKSVSDYNVLVEVPEYAIDEDTGQAVGVPFVLKAAREDQAFVSPISTMTVEQMKKSKMDHLSAKRTVAQSLGVAVDDIDEDFVKKSSEDPKFEEIRKTAVAMVFLSKEVFKKAMLSDPNMTEEKKKQIILEANNQIHNQLSQIKDWIKTNKPSLVDLHNVDGQTGKKLFTDVGMVIPDASMDSGQQDSTSDDPQTSTGNTDTSLTQSMKFATKCKSASNGDGAYNIVYTFIPEGVGANTGTVEYSVHSYNPQMATDPMLSCQQNELNKSISVKMMGNANIHYSMSPLRADEPSLLKFDIFDSLTQKSSSNYLLARKDSAGQYVCFGEGQGYDVDTSMYDQINTSLESSYKEMFLSGFKNKQDLTYVDMSTYDHCLKILD